MNGTVTMNKSEKKYKCVKKLVKQMIFLNAAICDEVIRLEEKINRSCEERRLLLKKVFQQQAVSMVQSSDTKPTGSLAGKSTSQSIAQLLGEAEKRSKRKATPPSSSKKRTTRELLEDSLKSKSKKSKSSAGSCKRLVQPIPLDETGRPVFPIRLGSLVIYCLGEIIHDRPGFHSAEHIYPVGFCSTREYSSVQNVEKTCIYTCKISDDDTLPQFEVSAEDSPNQVFAGATPSECHNKLIQAINENCPGAELPISEDRGAQFFGLSQPTIQNLIQSSPGARKCADYKWLKFDVAKEGCLATDDQHPLISFEALHKLPSVQQVISEKQRLLSPQSSTTLESSASLRSLLTSGPLVQGPLAQPAQMVQGLPGLLVQVPPGPLVHGSPGSLFQGATGTMHPGTSVPPVQGSLSSPRTTPRLLTGPPTP